MNSIIKWLTSPIRYFDIFKNNETSAKNTAKTAEALAENFLATNHIPGMSLSVSKNGKLIWSEGFGYARFDKKKKVKPHKTVFRIASISKSITGYLLGVLTAKKMIEIDRSIYYYLPEYPKKEYDFTTRQLAGNTTGIRHYKNNKEYALNKKMSITEGLSLFKEDSLLFEPGTEFHYSSLGFVLLSEIMQKAANKSFNTLVSDFVFEPLKMHRSFTDEDDAPTKHKSEFFSSSAIKKYAVASPVSNRYKVAGGGMLSTSEDIVRFGNEIIFHSGISSESIKEITTSQRLKSGNKTGYGMGFSIGTSINQTPKIYHTGGGVGASSILLIYPEEQMVIAVLTNKTGIKMEDFGNELEAFFVKNSN